MSSDGLWRVIAWDAVPHAGPQPGPDPTRQV